MSVDVSRARAEAEAFKALIEGKIHKLIEEFSEGKLSREQFQVLYERYNGRLSIATQALMSGNPEAIKIAQSGPSTIMVRDTYMGRAMGMVIYHDASGKLIETLGNFDVPPASVTATLMKFDKKRRAGEYIERQVAQLKPGQWLAFFPAKTTTVIVSFKNEPSLTQIREIERIHHDFELANRVFLEMDTVNVDELADPFIVFVQKWAGEDSKTAD